MSKRIILTGPTGAVGHALIEECLSHGDEVYAVCRPNSARMDTIPKHEQVHIVEADLSDLASVEACIPSCCDVFYHFGWEGTIGDGRNDMFLQNRNVRYTLDAVELACRLGCKAFIGAGSQAEYGRVEGMLQPDTPAFPENGYGMAKLCAGQMSRVKCQQYGIKHIWARILSVYGPYDSTRTMVMSTIVKLLQGERPAFTKGEQLWDYLYSKDAAGILYALAQKGVSGKVYCLGSGKARPLSEYMYAIRDAVDGSLPLGIGELPYAPKQVMYLCADTKSIQEDLGYAYRYSFEEGIAETVEWYKNRTAEKRSFGA